MLALTALFVSPALMAANGDLDTTFNGGAFDIHVGTNDGANCVIVQQDGRVLLGGFSVPSTNPYEGYWALVRRNSNGTLDSTFGSGSGQVVIPVGGFTGTRPVNGSIDSQVVQSDGKILAAGYGFDPTGTYHIWQLIRFNADGTLDASFGSGGKVSTPTSLSLSDDRPGAIALQHDGKPVVAGFEVSGANPNQKPVVARYTTAGVLDPTFATGGIFHLPSSFLGTARPVTIQPDGKILVGITGLGFGSGGNTIYLPQVMRLTSDGVLDSKFGAQGLATLNSAGDDLVGQVAVQPDGKIVVAGDNSHNTQGIVWRLNSNGALDTSFNGQGWLSVAMPVSAMALLPTGQVLVSGTDTTVPIQKLEVARVTAGGLLDTSFTNTAGQSGIVESAAPGVGLMEIDSMALAPDGRFVISGYDSDSDSSRHFMVARYQGDALRVRPKDFTFTSVTGVPVSTVQVSNVIRITSLTSGASVPIQVSGGSYSINGDPFVRRLGYVKNGDQVMVEHTSAATSGTAVTTTLKVGGLNAPNSPWIQHGGKVVATFTSTTQ